MSAVGEIIAGKYRVERPIGAGGMGTVVAATHLQLGTQVALKFLADKIKDSKGSIERFTREARACAGLRSEHICRVTDFGLHDNMPYIAMELLDGVDLAQLIANSSTATGMAVDFILQACTGLAEAHAHGIVHRDLKPGNLFLTRRPDGTPLVKVLDFGVAKIAKSEDASLTKTSSVIGSPGYMAPEQLRSSKTVDLRADIWALGVILYELISKRHPFAAEAVTEIALKIAMDEPDPLVEASDGLRAVVMRCLEKEPDQRFQTIEALAASLAPFQIVDRAAAIAAAKLWIESPWSRPLLPTTQPTAAFAATQATQPPAAFAATHATTPPAAFVATQASSPAAVHGVIEAPATRGSGRLVAIAVVGTLVLGGIAAFALTRGGGSTITVDAAVVATAPPDAAPVIDAGIAAPVVDAAVVVEIPVDAGKPLPLKPRKPPPTPPTKPPGPGSAAVPVPAKPDEPVTTPAAAPDPKREAEQLISRVKNELAVRGLLFEDLTEPMQKLHTEMTDARRAKDWAGVKDAATKLDPLIPRVILDRALIAKKSARLTAQLAARFPGEQMKTQILKWQEEATEMVNNGNLMGANIKLNGAFRMLPNRAPPPSDY